MITETKITLGAAGYSSATVPAYDQTHPTRIQEMLARLLLVNYLRLAEAGASLCMADESLGRTMERAKIDSGTEDPFDAAIGDSNLTIHLLKQDGVISYEGV